MIFREVLGNLRDMEITEKYIEKVQLEWYEADKRLLRKTTDRGTEVGIALSGARRLKQGDVLYAESRKVIAVEVLPTETIVLEPRDMQELAQVCYQLGNRHAPVFLDGEQVMVPFDQTVVELFNKLEIPVRVERRRLEHVLQPAAGHHH